MLNTDWEALYRNLSHLIATKPNWHAEKLQQRPSRETEQWLARVYAAVKDAGEIVDATSLRFEAKKLNTAFHDDAVREIGAILHRAWAVAEARAPASVQGSFIPAGATFDAYVALGRVLGEATSSLLVIDPYLDEKILTDFLPLVPPRVPVRLLAAAKEQVRSSLGPAHRRWVAQYGDIRPVAVRLAQSRLLHDRVIIVNGDKAWIATQSFNGFAARAPGSIELASPSATTMKIEAYDEIWEEAEELV